ncbi:pantoate--beta-alanine ligase [Myxococcota bacterium]|nr:pantoate--beta-alanine ligase [Myxococcota bacterium]
MQVIETVSRLQSLADTERASGRRIALVPTMGALHPGHLALVEAARERADRVWVSIFVNPTQFNDPADLDGYPRQLEADLDRCRECGVDVAFCPSVEEMYPAGSVTTVQVGELGESLCGASRPGHFDGVTTIVTKLLLASRPHVAVFGEKDYQQLAVIRAMARDLDFGVEIVGVATVREADGVALSSRNVRLTPEARSQARALVRALDAAESAVGAGEGDTRRILKMVSDEIAKAPLARVDYAEMRDPHSLKPSPPELAGAALLALAVFFPASDSDSTGGESVRLIDNRVLVPSGSSTQQEP